MSIKHPIQTLLVISLLIFISACSSQLQQSQIDQFVLPEGLYGHAVVNNGDKIFVLAGSRERGFSRDILILDPKTRLLVQLKDKLLPRRYHSAVWDGADSIYIVGGVSHWKGRVKLEPSVEVYNITTQEVKIIGEMPVPRRFGSAVYMDGKIIVSGGGILSRKNRADVEVIASNTVAIFDIKTNTWRKGADLPFSASTRTVALDKQIYAIGGYDGKNAYAHFSRYDPMLNIWTELPNLPQALSAHSVVATEDKIYTFGDYSDLSASYVYDPTDKTWQKSAFKYQASRHNAATSVDGKIYIIGGNVGSNGPFLTSIQIFTLE